MESLVRKLIKSLVIVALLFALSVQAQDFNQIQEAFRKSYDLETDGGYAEAIKALKGVYNEQDYIINLRLGWLNYENGNFTESVAYYKKAIQLKPYSVEPKFGLAYPASAMGNWNIVTDQYNEILKIDPENTVANYKLGMIKYSNQQYDEAYKHFEKVVNLYPFDYDSLIMFAWTNLKLGKIREAEVLFKQCLLYNPGDESATQGLEAIQ